MIGALIAVDAFASVVLGVILYASVFEVKRRTHKDYIFALFVGMNMLLTVSDMCSWVCDGKEKLLTLNYITSYITICGAYSATYVFARYLMANIELYCPIPRWQRTVLDVYTGTMTVIILIMCVEGRIFTLEGGHYTITEYYSWL